MVSPLSMTLRTSMLLLAVLCLRSSNALSKEKLIKHYAPVPENVRATFPSEPCGNSVLVQWTTPSHDFLIDSYLVTCETVNLDDRVVDVVGGDVYQAVIGPLRLDLTYRCSVSSTTSLHGTSKPAYSGTFLATK